MENIIILRQTTRNHHTHHIATKCNTHIKYVIHKNIYILCTSSSIVTHTSSYQVRHSLKYIYTAHIIKYRNCNYPKFSYTQSRY